MARHASPLQPDLFQPAEPARKGGYAALLQEPPPPDFIERIRRELTDTLGMVRVATSMPWGDLTKATLAELRFNSITNWLPDGEAATLRECFGREMAMLWDAAARAADGEA